VELIGKEAHVSYIMGGDIATVFGRITNIAPVRISFDWDDSENLTFIEVTDNEDVRYIPVKNIIHIHIGTLE